MDRHVIGGRPFIAVGESTVEHDHRAMALIQRAHLDEVVMEEGELPEDYARRLIGAVMEGEAALPLLACFILPEDSVPQGGEPGDFWTKAVAADTEKFLGSVRDRDDKVAIQHLTLGLLIHFFEQGLVSLRTSGTSSGTSPQANGHPEVPAATVSGPS